MCYVAQLGDTSVVMSVNGGFNSVELSTSSDLSKTGIENEITGFK